MVRNYNRLSLLNKFHQALHLTLHCIFVIVQIDLISNLTFMEQQVLTSNIYVTCENSNQIKNKNIVLNLTFVHLYVGIAKEKIVDIEKIFFERYYYDLI